MCLPPPDCGTAKRRSRNPGYNLAFCWNAPPMLPDRRSHDPVDGAENHPGRGEHGNDHAGPALRRIVQIGDRIDAAADHPDQSADRGDLVGKQQSTEPQRRQEEHHLLHGVHLHPMSALEILVAGDGRRLDAVLSPRLADYRRQDQIEQQREQRRGGGVDMAHGNPPDLMCWPVPGISPECRPAVKPVGFPYRTPTRIVRRPGPARHRPIYPSYPSPAQYRVMRPSLLNPLFASVTALAGIAGKTEKLYGRRTGRDTGSRVLDLVFHLPAGTVDRRHQPKLRDVVPGSVVTVAVNVESYRQPPPNRPRAPFQVYTSDDTGTLTITYFSIRKEQIEKMLPRGSRRYVSGTVTSYDGMLQMTHPDRVVDAAGFAAMALVEPVYPATEGLSQNMLRRAVTAALNKLPALPEWLDPAYLARASWPDFAGALAKLHRPSEPADVALDGKAWSRLPYDEKLGNQLGPALGPRPLRA